ncbi:hypothetical protein J4216_02945 [Candidatus Woesearchaeota archaeon]|nr:hypothetical protein [Candidatus Woesearchaeota archaeon]
MGKTYENIKDKFGYGLIGVAVIDIIQRQFTGNSLYELINEHSLIKSSPELVYDIAVASAGILSLYFKELRKTRMELKAKEARLEENVRALERVENDLGAALGEIERLKRQKGSQNFFIIKEPEGPTN